MKFELVFSCLQLHEVIHGELRTRTELKVRMSSEAICEVSRRGFLTWIRTMLEICQHIWQLQSKIGTYCACNSCRGRDIRRQCLGRRQRFPDNENLRGLALVYGQC